VNSQDRLIDNWTFGGGTAPMLQIGHRESRDIDIFLPDPQLLSFLDPETHDFTLEMQPTDYKGDGAKSLKLVFENIGEIDFIVGGSLTSTPTKSTTVEGEVIQLETIPEIIAKKVHHRGSAIQPRDIFDIAAASEAHANAIVRELKSYKDDVAKTLAVVERLNPDFVNRAIADLAIKPKYEALSKTAIERTRQILRAV
jgi:nucleotidyltransferase AbiEii toxin of type IV toxin-antitoxin system